MRNTAEYNLSGRIIICVENNNSIACCYVRGFLIFYDNAVAYWFWRWLSHIIRIYFLIWEFTGPSERYRDWRFSGCQDVSCRWGECELYW
jgi:hypothetical protein